MIDSSASGRVGFAALRLESVLERGLEAAGFDQPRPIQAQAIPAALEGRDILGLAQTGTGKTAAFALPLLDRLVARRARGPRALILAPTRELATQIDREIRTLARFTKLRTLTIYGGANMGVQIRGLHRRPDILVACPGRLLDLHERGHVDFSGIEALVLDEADHMFDMGFLPSLQRILDLLPAKRQNLLFSATMPKEIRRLADRVLDRPHVVELGDSKPVETVDHALYPVRPDRKKDMVKHLLGATDQQTAIVFTRTRHRAKSLATYLAKAGYRATALQGNMTQGARDRAMRSFRNGQVRVLVATDVVARGIDVSGVACVINFDAPNTPEAYTHRIGRTGRSGRSGRACTLVSNDDRAWIQATERFLKEALPREEVPGFEGVVIRAADRRPKPSGSSGSRPRRFGGPRGGRGRKKRNTSRRTGS